MLIPPQWFHKGFSLDRDTEYLLYMQFNTMLMLGFYLFIALLIDALLRTGLFIDDVRLDENKLLFPDVLLNLLSPLNLIITAVFYLRIRLPLKMRDDEIPVMMHRALLIGYSQRRWLWRCTYLIALSLPVFWVADTITVRFVLHFHQQDNFLFVIISTAFFVVSGSAACAVFCISYVLVLEKVLRFFPEFEQDLLKKNPLPRNY
ncbi:MAG: hypothetical protein HYU57_01100 [Micavibrio aeruginosavorus]|nr:hypothetical protein [Micavibrio aeruginosavorus]